MLALMSGLAVPASAACPEGWIDGRVARLDAMDLAEQRLFEADLAGADLRLQKLEEALGCGSIVETALLARIWLLEGAWLTLKGDAEAAGDSWRAAARVAPGQWVEGYGDNLRRAYDQANAAPDLARTATIVLDPPLFQWIGAVDGVVTTFPVVVAPGLHLVQVGPNEDDIAFSKLFPAFANTASVVATGVIEPTTAFGLPGSKPDEDEVDHSEPRPPPKLSLYAGAVADVAFGRPVEPVIADGVGEPAVKLVLPIETGVVVRPAGRAWLRAVGTAGPLVGGAFVHDDKYGDTESPTALGGHLAGGISGSLGDLGLLAGFQWPDRVPVRGVIVGRLPRFPVQGEARIGMNAAFGRPPEPAIDLAAALTPALWRRPRPVPAEPEPEDAQAP